MYYLLDTRVFLSWLANDRFLSKKAATYIKNAKEIFISSASIWEAKTKIELGKLAVNLSDLVATIEAQGFSELPITAEHIALATKLPNHHRDQIDRILIAQAIHHPLRLLTMDEKLKSYSELVEVV